MKFKKRNKHFLYFIIFAISYCGSQEAIEDNNDAITTTTTTIVIDEITTTTSVVKEPQQNQCDPDDNSNINFESKKDLQKFLNKYGFNAGEEDGYFGYQSTEALRKFQAFAGISPDGDLGPITKETIKNWTGCEKEVNSYTSAPTTTIVSNNEESEQSSTSSTTTTTLGNVEIDNDQSNSGFGFIPSIGLDTNNLVSVFKGVGNNSSVCGTPFYNNVPSGALNYYSNGIISENSILPSVYLQSSNTAKILTNSNDAFAIEILGNGDNTYNFYFIPPFSNQVILIKPLTIDISPGKTIATFSKNSLESGYWFFAYAENQSGKIIKSSSPREFTVGNTSPQTYSGSIEAEILNFNINGRNVGGGETLSNSDVITISYITKGVYDEKPSTTKDIQKDDLEITLTNNEQASPGDLLIINNEIMKVISKDNNKYKVQRGFNNTEPKKHLTGASVKQINDLDSNKVNSTYALLVLRSESGKRFQVRLNGEIASHSFSLSGCPNDRYLFEEIKTFSWREEGKSIVASSSAKNVTGSIFNKSFIISESNNKYSPPSLKSTDSDSGGFANSGPRNVNTSAGSEVVFNFSGLQKGSSDLKFVEIKFQMLPTTGSTKSSTNRSVFFAVNDGMEFKIKIDSVVSSTAFKSSEWESGYRYIFAELNVYDQLSKTTFKSNGMVSFDDLSNNSTHDVYYLDQFSFNIP